MSKVISSPAPQDLPSMGDMKIILDEMGIPFESTPSAEIYIRDLKTSLGMDPYEEGRWSAGYAFFGYTQSKSGAVTRVMDDMWQDKIEPRLQDFESRVIQYGVALQMKSQLAAQNIPADIAFNHETNEFEITTSAEAWS